MKNIPNQKINLPEYYNLSNLISLLKEVNEEKIRESLNEYHPSEIASFIQVLNSKERRKILKILKNDFNNQILIELDPIFLENISDEIDVNIEFLISADYTLNTWYQNTFNVFEVDITNNSNNSIEYYVQFKMYYSPDGTFDIDNPIFTGVSKDQILEAGDSKTFTDDILNENIDTFFEGKIAGWTSNFMSDVQRAGYLLPGDYQIEVKVFSSYVCRSIYNQNECLEAGCEWYKGELYAEGVVACQPSDYNLEADLIRTKIFNFTKSELGKNIIIDNPVSSEDFDPLSSQLSWSTTISIDDFLSRVILANFSIS